MMKVGLIVFDVGRETLRYDAIRDSVIIYVRSKVDEEPA